MSSAKQPEQLSKAKRMIDDFKASFESEIEALVVSSEKLLKACNKVAESWSGSFAGYHGRLYYRNFVAPPMHDRFSIEWGGIHGISDGWAERDADDVKQHIEKLASNISLDDVEKRSEKLRSAAQKFQEEIALHLSSYPFSKEQSKQKQLLEKIEHQTLGNKKELFVQARLPRQLMSRDSEAIMQGICTPAHIFYEGVALETASICESTSELLKETEKLIRYLEVIPSSLSQELAEDLSQLHKEICLKCNALYQKGEYAEAVEKSFKVVRDRLRNLTGFETGSDAFGKTKLFIKGATAPNVEKDFNEGVKFLTMAIDKFRNEKSHTSNARIDNPSKAYEYLSMSSLAMNLLDKAEMR